MLLESIPPSVWFAIAGSVGTGVVGYFVFRNDERNKHASTMAKIDIANKDITKNDERIRKEFKEQNVRNDKIFTRLEKDLTEIRSQQIIDGHDKAANQEILNNLKATTQNISDKLDIIIKTRLTGK